MKHIEADRMLDCAIQVWTRKMPKPGMRQKPLTARELMVALSPPATFSELRLIVQTVRRVNQKRTGLRIITAQPIIDAKLPERRERLLMSIAVARMKELGIKRWEAVRDYSNRRR